MKILVIEDERLLAATLKTLLRKKGFDVECVYDGEDGADYALTGVYDLLILDVMMPKMGWCHSIVDTSKCLSKKYRLIKVPTTAL